MLKVLLIAGEQTDSLAKYFNERGTLQVVRRYNNLVSNVDDIDGKILDVDKLVYVYNPSSEMNIKRDMGALKKLLKHVNEGISFFNVREISFFMQEDENSDNVLKFFNAAMREVEFENVNVYTPKEELTYIDIYNNLLGTTEGNNVNHTYMNIVRKPRGSQIKNVYDPKIKDVNLEPFTYEHLDDHEKAKSNANKIGMEVKYTDLDSGLEKFDRPYLGSFEVDDIFSKKNIYIVTGLPRTGVSTNTCVFATSSTLANKTVTVVNLTSNSDTQDYLRTMKTKCSKYSMGKFILLDKLEHKNLLNLIHIPHTISDVRKEGLGYILSHSNKIDSDIIIIECDNSMLDYVVSLCKYRIVRIFYSCETLEKDINNTFSYLNHLAEDNVVTLMLTELLREMKGTKRLDYEKIKKRFKDNLKIVAPVRYDEFPLDTLYYEQLLHV